jgi:hypothetical protein
MDAFRPRVLSAAVAAWLSALAAAGCGGGDGLPRKEVTGSVTLDGQPLAEGTLQLQPEGAGPGGTAVSAGGIIKGGRFRIAAEAGPVPGTYKVLIFSHGGAGQPGQPAAAPGAQTGPPPERIPARYNEQSSLTAAVAADGANEFSFDLKSK